MFSSINQTFGCCIKIFGCSSKKLFVAVTKPFFSVLEGTSESLEPKFDRSKRGLDQSKSIRVLLLL